MRISDWSSDVCSSDLQPLFLVADVAEFRREGFDEVAARDLSQPHDAAPIGTGRQRGMIERGIGLEQRPFGIDLRGAPLPCGRQPLRPDRGQLLERSEEHPSEPQSLMRTSYAVF